MEKNKTGKYLKYAIGEIVLVVIGILIALSINNWNESRKETIQEQFILKRLSTDINSDINQVSNEIGLIDKNSEELKFCIDVILRKKEVSISVFRDNLRSILNLISHSFKLYPTPAFHKWIGTLMSEPVIRFSSNN